MRVRRPCFRAARLLPGLTAGILLLSWPGPVHAAGGWETHIRTRDFTDLRVTDDAVWCATSEAGLLRFDRFTRQFSFIQREPGSIASNELSSLAIDARGRLWVGTVGSGASLLTAAGWVLVNAFDGLPKDSVTTMTPAGDTLWIGTRGGIALWDGRQVLGSLPDGNTVSFDTTFSLPAITGVEQMGDTLWLATPRGVGFARISTNLTDWREASVGLRTPAVDRLASDGHTLYALSDGFVHRWDPDSLKWFSIGFIGIVYNLEDEAGTVLASTSAGVWWHRANLPLFTQIVGSPVAGPGRNNGDAGVAPGGDMPRYCATAAGLYEEPAGGGAWTLHTPPGPPGNGYSNIVIDGPRVYAATRFEGIGRWDGTSWFAWLPGTCPGECPNSFRNALEVFAMSVDRLGRKWVSCWGFAIEAFADSVEPHQFEHHWPNPAGQDALHTYAFGAAVDSTGARGPSGEPLDQGGHWFGMDTNDLGNPQRQPLGLDYYDSTGAYAGTWSPGNPPASLVRNGKIRAVTVDRTGRIWIGYAGEANSGVDHFVGRPEQGYDFRTVPNTTDFDVWSLVAHGDTVWVLTSGDLRRISLTTQRLAGPSYPTLAGRPLGMRLMDVAPNGDVYVGSENGVRRYRPGGGFEDITVANSPLASNDVRAIAVDRATGVVWFGTDAGLNRFDPGYTPPAPPPGAPDTLLVFPNPSTLTGAGIEMRLVGASAGYDGAIYDLRGRLIRRFVTRVRGQIFWDGRDQNGNLVKPGIYFVRAESNGREARARVVLLD